MIRKRILFGLLVCVLVLASCASAKKPVSDTQVISVEPVVEETPEEVVEEEVDLGDGNWLSALGSINGLDIKSYKLRGEGPDGASFDWIEVTGTKVALSDVRRGQWTLYAQAIGENGDILASGKLETFLSNSSPTGALYMDSEVGEGDVRCSFAWNTFQVLYPSIEIYVKKNDGEYVARDASEISIGDGVAVWNAKDVGAGSYVVRALLKDEGEVVAGVAAAMRIIDGKQSVGDVRFTVGKLSAIYGISLENTPTVTVKGNLELGENGNVSFVSDFTDLRYDWFLNGEYVEGENSDTLNIFQTSEDRGFFRLDCIVQNSNNTSINSASILVYSDGNVARVVTVEEAEAMKGDKPENYEEIETNSEATVNPVVVDEEVQKVIDKAFQQADETNVEAVETVEGVEAVENVVENTEQVKEAEDEILGEEKTENVEDEDVVYYVTGELN
jgi:hypothetical protein